MKGLHVARTVASVLAGVLVGCRPTLAPTGSQCVAGTPTFVARQKVIALHDGKHSSFDAVVQFDGSSWVVLGLTPMGTKAFAIEQAGDGVRVHEFIDIPLPAAAHEILRDVQRAYSDLPTHIRRDGWHRRHASNGGSRWRERWADARLAERVWSRQSGPASTHLQFQGGLDPCELPDQIKIDHPELGLTLEIHTLALERTH